jgi:hypothetical protein
MKQNGNRSLPIVSLIALLSCFLAGCASHDTANTRESEIYAPSQIHHHPNGERSTVSVEVPEHNSFRNGKYVPVPAYTAEAPLPHGKYRAAYWVPRTTTKPGHWYVQGE